MSFLLTTSKAVFDDAATSRAKKKISMCVWMGTSRLPRTDKNVDFPQPKKKIQKVKK